MGKQVYTQEERRAQFIKTGIALAKKDGINKVSISAVAAKHKVTAPLVFHIFGNREKFRTIVAAEAKKQGITLPGSSVPTKRKLTAAQVQAIKRKEGGKGKPVKTPVPTAGNGARSRKPGKKPVAPPSKAGKFAALPVPTGEAVDTNLSPKV